MFCILKRTLTTPSKWAIGEMLEKRTLEIHPNLWHPVSLPSLPYGPTRPAGPSCGMKGCLPVLVSGRDGPGITICH